MKRTTSRKYYFAVRPAAKQDETHLGTIAFFGNLKHMDIVNGGKSSGCAATRGFCHGLPDGLTA